MDELFNNELEGFLATIAKKYGCDFKGSIEGCLNNIQLSKHDQEVTITVMNGYKLKDSLVDKIYEYFIKNNVDVEPLTYKPVGELLTSYTIKWHN